MGNRTEANLMLFRLHYCNLLSFSEAGSRINHPTKPLRALARTPTVCGFVGIVSGLCAVMWLQKTGSRVKPVMTQLIDWGVCFREPFHHFTFPPFHLKNTFPPVVAPIYYRGIALIRITLSNLGLPGVNLIIYKDDLRMMV